MPDRSTLLVLVFVLPWTLLSGCSSLRGTGLAIWPANWGKEEGYIWCNARYLDLWAYCEPNSVDPTKDARLAIADRGYIYALAAGLVLQKAEEQEDKHFHAPAYLVHVKKLDEDDPHTGFQASTFEYRDPNNPQNLREVIIAFRGTDEFTDWIKHNLAIWWEPVQFTKARLYIKRIAQTEEYRDRKLVVAGFSLGGGLAVHVTLNEETSVHVKEAWALNPSPRIGNVNADRPDSRVNVAAVQGEFLEVFRQGKLGAPDDQFSNDYGLIKSSSVYGHGRWVLLRQMLYFADLVAYEKSGRTALMTQPLEIIMNSNVPNGCTEHIRGNLKSKGRVAKSPEM